LPEGLIVQLLDWSVQKMLTSDCTVQSRKMLWPSPLAQTAKVMKEIR